MRETEPGSVSAALLAHLRQDIAAAGGWIPFDRFMHAALYTPGLGYYARGESPIGLMPAGAFRGNDRGAPAVVAGSGAGSWADPGPGPGSGSGSGPGSDFVTAPVLSPFFGRAMAAQVAQGLQAAQADEVFEFGAGTGALAQQLLDALGDRVRCYTIVEVSAGLREQQRRALARFGDRVQWAERLPQTMHGVVLGNEVLDAMPAQLLSFDGHTWCERGVVWHEGTLCFGDRPTPLRPPVAGPFVPGTVLEIQPQAQAFVATLAEHLSRGLALFIDYGFPEAELYHPQRTGGTLMCHRAHRADGNPLADVGLKDITVHVDFTAVALAAQDAGLTVAGYTSQARFLLNCGIAELLERATLPERAAAQKLLTEHEMGELFKVIAFTRGLDEGLLGFSAGDRTHRL